MALPATIISIVDDDDSFREATKCLVKLLGFATAANPEKFVKAKK